MKLTTLLFGAAAAGGLFLLLPKKDKTQHKGDDAKVGDQVWYGVAQIRAALGQNALPAAINADYGFIIQQVTGFGEAGGTKTIVGPIVGYAPQEDVTSQLVTPTPPVQIPANLAVGVMRGNTRIA